MNEQELMQEESEREEKLNQDFWEIVLDKTLENSRVFLDDNLKGNENSRELYSFPLSIEFYSSSGNEGVSDGKSNSIFQLERMEPVELTATTTTIKINSIFLYISLEYRNEISHHLLLKNQKVRLKCQK